MSESCKHGSGHGGHGDGSGRGAPPIVPPSGGDKRGGCHDPYLRCALYGAAQAALGVRGCCVLSHSPQGCFQLVDAAFGWQDADYTETLTLCTKLCEDEIVHGGEEVLARTIREAAGLNVPILFVVTACGPEIVGDDVTAVCEELRAEVGFEIVPIRCAGFRGDQNLGTDLALEAILEHLAPAQGRWEAIDERSSGPRPHGRWEAGDERPRGAKRVERSVALIAPHASGNPTWMGDLAWVRAVLARLGATDVVTLTHDTELEDFRRLPTLEGCLILSHDAGQKAADWLAERYGTAQWCKGLPLPIGFTNTRAWLRELGARLGAEAEAERLIVEGERRVVLACRRKGLEISAMHRAPAAIVADATVGIPLVRFITEDLEMVPTLVCLRSGQAGTEELLASELAALGLAPRVIHHADVYQARSALALGPECHCNSAQGPWAAARPEIVLGSNIERHAAEPLGIPYVFRLVNPISRFRMTDRAYMGYTGMLNLIETMQNDWLDRYRSKKRRYRARW